jgi:UDP-N-acetylglucosamine 2-epimerase (non-hydrolysing)
VKRALMIFGTRPEAIKLAPIAISGFSDVGLEIRICVTGQHRAMLDDAMRVFGLKPDYDLKIMRPGQSLSDIASAVFHGLDQVLERCKPDWVLVQGDTTTTMTAALAAFHRRIAVGHVEAGLRTGDLQNPWPEEANRRITSIVTTRHYCSTQRARQALLAEQVPDQSILVTGNTVVDALNLVLERIASDAQLRKKLQSAFHWLDPNRRMILVTGHRRESFGEGFLQICRALATLAQRDDVQIVYPVHLNPNVRQPVFSILGNSPTIKLIEPVDYESFIWLMNESYFILTDSGGVQEEAPTLGKPVLVMRQVTERQEAVEAGVSQLVGTRADRIVAVCTALLSDVERYRRMSTATNPFGDGTAAQRIIRDLIDA